MARRRKKSSSRGGGGKGLPLVGIGLLVIAMIGVVFFLASRKTDSFSTVDTLNAADYVENARSLRGNVYQVTGRILERLDDWRSSQGHVYSVETDDGTPLPILVPAEHTSMNIERDQRFTFKVDVVDGGMLVAQELEKR